MLVPFTNKCQLAHFCHVNHWFHYRQFPQGLKWPLLILKCDGQYTSNTQPNAKYCVQPRLCMKTVYQDSGINKMTLRFLHPLLHFTNFLILCRGI